MVQVIHYPSVLYQWLVAATAEMLRFEQQLVDFHHLPFLDTPLIYELAMATNYIVILVKGTIVRCFCILQQLILEHKSTSETSALKCSLGKLQEELDVILHQLEKVCSAKGQGVIKAFKRMCWDESKKGPLIPKFIDLSTMCTFNQDKFYQRKNWANGIKGNNFFFPAIATECSHTRCASCAAMKEEEIKERREFEDCFKADPIYKDLALTMNKMVRFYDDHLEARFPPEAKTDRFLAHLVNKEMLYLQWKFEITQGMIQI
jgi:hypothetical protein